ncbi:rootletin [Harmonia axyridis]|uniref:rootletin n=1 Tax=Harmonia axyridis TaxID=115357 RepID=UPI001E2767E2|nr:rootletin [Harmonia axyridis]
MSKRLLSRLRARSRSPIYVASEDVFPTTPQDAGVATFGDKPPRDHLPVEPRIATEEEVVLTSSASRRPPLQPATTCEDACEMSRPLTSSRKPEPKKPSMAEKKRLPGFRPKSRAEASSLGSSSRSDGGRLRGDGGGGSSDDDTFNRENLDLRIKLQEEASLYKRRLDQYRQAQSNQASLISRLQAKVLQYKKRCSELEAQMANNIYPTDQLTPPTSRSGISAPGPSSALEQAQMHLRESREERISDLDTALRRLEEERRRCETLMKLNGTLRDQLEESHQTNEALTVDLQKLTNDWEVLREEMLIKEEEWREEEQTFNDYYSSEHNKLLNLWRDVVAVKRMFTDVQTDTERDLKKLRSEVEVVGRDVASACDRIETKVDFILSNHLLQDQERYQQEQAASKLREEIEDLKLQNDSFRAEIDLKEERMQELLKDVQMLEGRCTDMDQGVSQVGKMQEEIDILQSALRDIAHALIQDAEVVEPELLMSSHIHLSGSTSVPQKSPKRTAHGVASSAAFAESTISAVQAALHKYQSFIHGLQVKLQSNKEQLVLVRKQYENSEENVQELEKRAKELVAQLDASRAQCSQLAQDREILQKSLETVKLDKNALDKTRIELGASLENLSNDYKKLQKTAQILQKESENLQDEKVFLQSEIDRLNQNIDLGEMNIRSEEDRSSRLREELLTVREELNKLYLSHDMLEQQKLEADILISSLEKTKADYELQLDRLMGDKSEVHDSLLKKQNVAAILEADKNKLQEELKKMQDERTALQLQCNDHQNDIQSLRKELLQAEQQRLDLESDRVSLTEKCKFLEMDKGKIEMELNQVTRERNDLSNQLTVLGRKKDAVNEEVMRLKQKLEQASETNGRVNRNLEELVKECEEKQCTMDSMDKEIQRLQELLASSRSEKEALEAVLFDTQTNLEACDVKKSNLEKELQEQLVKQEQLKSQANRLAKELERSEKKSLEMKTSLSQQAGNKEAEFRQNLESLKQQNEENVRKLTEERDKIRRNLEKRMQQSLQQLGSEKDAEIQQLLDRVESLQNHIDTLCQQHEELMLRAENDKQQALLLAHHDHQALHDRYEGVRRELEGEKETLERFKREANSRLEQDRININQLKEELNKYKTKLEEAKTRTEEEKIKLEQRISEVTHEKEVSVGEAENLKIQLNLTENKCSTINDQLHETIRKLKEVENHSDSLRKELTDVRRQLADSTFEKEKYHATNKDLRDHIKKTESEKRDQARQIEEYSIKISSLEEMKSSIETERNRFQNQVRDLEKELTQSDHSIQSLKDEIQKAQTAGNQQQAEEKELQARLLNEMEERERSHQEVLQLRKQISELERNLEHCRQELNRSLAHTGHLEEQWHAREQDLLVHLEDSRAREKRLEDQKHNLEVCLVDATQQIQELKAKLGGSEGKVRALENQLAQLEGNKREVEQKLSSVVMTLRRIAGVQLDGTVTMPYRLMSPSRRWSPARSHDDSRDLIVDVDPEVVRKGVRNLMQQVAHIERERDDYKNQVDNVKKQLKEVSDSQSKGDSKLTKITQNMRSLQEEKGSLETRLGQKTVELQSQTEALNKKTVELKTMREKIVSLELSVGSGQAEKQQYEEKLEKMKLALSRLESEKRGLQDELTRLENRSTKLELQRMSADGDLQRLQMMLQEKEVAIQKLQEKCESQGRAMASLEERCVSLKSTIDQLNLSLERAANSESETKAEIQKLQRDLLEATTSSQTGSEKLKQFQKSLSTCENERRLINERFEVTQQNLAELRRNNQILQDQVSRLNQELANNEVVKSSLESQLRLAQWPSETVGGGKEEEELHRQLQTCQKERNEYRAKLDSLSSKMRHLENENRNLERSSLSKSLARTKSYELPMEKYQMDSQHSETEKDKHELENRELRSKIARLESELTEKELELSRLRSLQRSSLDGKFDRAEIERYRAAQLQAERLLEAREQSYRQQVARLENQVSLLRDQLNQEVKRRQQYVLRSTQAGREMAQLRQTLGDSLKTVAQDPSLDSLLLEHETKRLDHSIAATSLPPSLALPTSSSSAYLRSLTPQPK